MKVECRYCSKILNEEDVFMDTDQKGRFYFFCDQEHRNIFEKEMMKHKADVTIMMHPLFGLVLMGTWFKNKFMNKKK